MSVNYVRLYEVTRKAAWWRDLDVKEQRIELLVKISLVVGILLVVTGIVLGIYYSVTTTTSHTVWNGWRYVVHKISNAPFSTIPVVLGSAALIALAIGLYKSNFEWRRNHTGSFAHQEIVELLTKSELIDIYNQCYKKNGGLTPFVQKGYLLPAQGETLRVLLKEYHEKSTVMLAYVARQFTRRAIDENRPPQEYHQARLRTEELNLAWCVLRTTLREQFQVQVPAKRVRPKPPQNPIPKPIFKTLSDAALTWRDLSTKAKNQERAIKIALIAGAVITLIGVALACYFCCTTTRIVGYEYQRFRGLVPILASNDVWCPIPPLIGAPALIIMIGSIFRTNYETSHGVAEALDKRHIRDDTVIRLSEGALEDVYRHFYKTHGGLTPLVRRGFLTASQGDQLRELFKEFEEIKKPLAAYDVNPDPFTQALRQEPEQSRAYASLIELRQNLRSRFKVMQEEIKENFTDSTRLDTLPDDVLQHLFTFLPVKDLKSVAQLKNSHLKGNARQAMGLRAQEYGSNLDKLFAHVKTLAANGYIPDPWIVYRKGVDAEGTVRKICFLKPKNQEKLAVSLGRALVAYTQQGDFSMVKTLVKLGANLEGRDREGYTPLIRAAMANKLKIAAFLIKEGADTNAFDNKGWTPLAWTSSVAMMRLVLENKGALTINRRGSDGRTILHSAAQKNLKKHVALLLQFGADRNSVDYQHRTAWHLTTSREVKFILESFVG